MSRNLFIGDLHLGHSGISNKFRNQFTSDEEHDNVIIDNILSSVSKRDTLWLLGDIVLKVEKFKMLDSVFKSCMRVNVIMGNHDHQALPRYCMTNFSSVYVYGVVKKFGCWIQHTPIHEDELYRGAVIHGHTHSKSIDNPRYISVSCEQVGYTPISLDEIREKFHSRGVAI